MALLLGLLLQADPLAEIDAELAREAVRTADTLIRIKAYDEARGLIEMVGAKTMAQRDEFNKLLDRIKDKPWRGEGFGAPIEGKLREFAKPHCSRYYKLARGMQDKAAARRADTHGEILDDLVDHLRALARVNAVRVACGFRALKYDWDRSAGAMLHARYLLNNPNDGGRETDGREGFTPEGKAAAPYCAWFPGRRLPPAVDLELQWAFGRTFLLRPALGRIGFGQATLGSATTAVIDVTGGIDDKKQDEGAVAIYPFDKQTDVPCADGRETPDPVTARDGAKAAGLPVSVIFFDPAAKPRDAKLRIAEAGGGEVACNVSTPESPACPSNWPTNAGSVIAIPVAPFKPRTQYHVSFECTLRGETFKKRWWFATGK